MGRKEEKPVEEPKKNNVNVDDLIKKIDARIAELEKEEELAKASPFAETTEKPVVEENTNKDENVSDFLEFAKAINDDIIKDEESKPKINIDADSIIVDENITDDEFFDDFFGDDED